MSNSVLVGILQLEQGKTYGRQVKSNGKPGKLFYGIIPGNKDDIPVKVAYEPIKTTHNNSVICNIHRNRFVSYKITQLLEGQRSIAVLIDNFGPVDSLDAFIKYRLLLKKLELKPKFGKSLIEFIPEIREHAINSIHNGETITIMTIDPEGCRDIDDGVGLTNHEDGTHMISICITHLPSYLTSSKVNLSELESQVVNPCSVYLPCQTIHMFDEKFSLNTFSLIKERTCPVLALCLHVSQSGDILQHKLKITNAYVSHNYAYDSEELKANACYASLFRVVNTCFVKNPVPLLASINDSHDVVAYLMILMNSYCGNLLKSMNTGIFRQANPIKDLTLPNELQQLKHIVCNRASKYICIDEVNGEPYVHITSPMRRLPDLVNMLILSQYLMPNSDYEVFKPFISRTLYKTSTIDSMCKAAKKIGDEANLLNMIATQQIDTSKTYDGIVIENLNEEEHLYSIFIEQIGRWFKLKSRNSFDRFQMIKCRLAVFENASTCIRKVRVYPEN